MRTKVVAKVTICQACGDPGFLGALLVCSNCKICVEHRYCQINRKKAFGNISKWLCGLCISRVYQRHLSNLAIKRSLQIVGLKTRKVHGGFKSSAVGTEQRYLSTQSWNSDIQNSLMAVGAKSKLDNCELKVGTLAVEEVFGDGDPRADFSGHSSTGLFSDSKPAIDAGALDGKMSLERKRKLNEEVVDGELLEQASKLLKSIESNSECANGRNFNKIYKSLPLKYDAGLGSCKKADGRTTGVVSENCHDFVRDYSKSENNIDSRIIKPADMARLEAHNVQPFRTSTSFCGKDPVLKEMEVTESVNLPREEKIQNSRMRLSNAGNYIGKGKRHQIASPDNEQNSHNSNFAQGYSSRSDCSPAKHNVRNGGKLVIGQSSYGSIVPSSKASVLPDDPPKLKASETDDSQLFPTNPSGEGYVAPLAQHIWSGSFAIATETHTIVCKPMQAHLSDIACKNEKVRDESRMIPWILNLEMCPRLESWPKSFVSSKPTANSIALYFFPGTGGERAGPTYEELLVKAVRRDCIFKATLEAAELLIIPSVHLPAELHTFQGKFYLWGIFKRKQSPVPINYCGKDEVAEGRDALPCRSKESEHKILAAVDNSNSPAVAHVCNSPTPQEDAAADRANADTGIRSSASYDCQMSKLGELPRKLAVARELTPPAQSRGGQGDHDNDDETRNFDRQAPCSSRADELPSPEDKYPLPANPEEEKLQLVAVEDKYPLPGSNGDGEGSVGLQSLHSRLRELRALLLAIPCKENNKSGPPASSISEANAVELQSLCSQLLKLTENHLLSAIPSGEKEDAAATKDNEVVPPANSKERDADGVDLQSLHSRLHELRARTDNHPLLPPVSPCEEKHGDDGTNDYKASVAPCKGVDVNHNDVTGNNDVDHKDVTADQSDLQPTRLGMDDSSSSLPPVDDPQPPFIPRVEKDGGAPANGFKSNSKSVLDHMDEMMEVIQSIQRSKELIKQVSRATQHVIMGEALPGDHGEQEVGIVGELRVLCVKADSDGFWRLLISSHRRILASQLDTHLLNMLLRSCNEPAQFVLDVLANGFPPYSSNSVVNHEWACLLLLKSLLAAIDDEGGVAAVARPVVVSHKTKKHAREMVRTWKHLAKHTWRWKADEPTPPPPHAHVFLALVVTFGVSRDHEMEMYGSIAMELAWKRGVPQLAAKLGLDGAGMVLKLLARRSYVPALFLVQAFNLGAKFSPCSILCEFVRTLKGCGPTLMAQKLESVMCVVKAFGLNEPGRGGFPANCYSIQIKDLDRRGTRKEAELLKEKVLSSLESLEWERVRMSGDGKTIRSSRTARRTEPRTISPKTKKKSKGHREEDKVKWNQEHVARDATSGRNMSSNSRGASRRDVPPAAVDSVDREKEHPAGNVVATRKSISFKMKVPAGGVKKSKERNPLRMSEEKNGESADDDDPKYSKLKLSWNPWDKKQDSEMQTSGCDDHGEQCSRVRTSGWDDDRDQGSRMRTSGSEGEKEQGTRMRTSGSEGEKEQGSKMPMMSNPPEDDKEQDTGMPTSNPWEVDKEQSSRMLTWNPWEGDKEQSSIMLTSSSWVGAKEQGSRMPTWSSWESAKEQCSQMPTSTSWDGAKEQGSLMPTCSAWEDVKEQGCRMSTWSACEDDKDLGYRVPTWSPREDDKLQGYRMRWPPRRSDDSDCQQGYKRTPGRMNRPFGRGCLDRRNRPWDLSVWLTPRRTPPKRRFVSPPPRYCRGSPPSSPLHWRRLTSPGFQRWSPSRAACSLSPVSPRSHRSRFPSPRRFVSPPLRYGRGSPPPSPSHWCRTTSPGFQRWSPSPLASRSPSPASPRSYHHRSPSPRYVSPSSLRRSQLRFSPCRSSSPIRRGSPRFLSSSPTPPRYRPASRRYFHRSSPGFRGSTSSSSSRHPENPVSPRFRGRSPPPSRSPRRGRFSPSPQPFSFSPSPRRFRDQRSPGYHRSASRGCSRPLSPASPRSYRHSPTDRLSSPVRPGTPPFRSASPIPSSTPQSPQRRIPSSRFNPSPSLGSSGAMSPGSAHFYGPAFSPSSHLGPPLPMPCYGQFQPPPTHWFPPSRHWFPPQQQHFPVPPQWFPPSSHHFHPPPYCHPPPPQYQLPPPAMQCLPPPAHQLPPSPQCLQPPPQQPPLSPKSPPPPPPGIDTTPPPGFGPLPLFEPASPS